jgi:arabinan endo-1,5-alpha-L-arabinosidase
LANKNTFFYWRKIMKDSISYLKLSLVALFFITILPLNSFSQTLTVPFEGHDPSGPVRASNGYIIEYVGSIEWMYRDIKDEKWYDGGKLSFGSKRRNSNWAPHSPISGLIYCSDVIKEDAEATILRVEATGGTAPNYQWGEAEVVTKCTPASLEAGGPWAIDPAIFWDDEGEMWLVHGSYWSGIWLLALDRKTGLLPGGTDPIYNPENPAFIQVATYGGKTEDESGGPIEAAYIYNRPDSPYYYLFVNWEICCSRMRSTYEIRVGRLKNPRGPYLDKEGVDMAKGGGSIFMDREGTLIGDSYYWAPGHANIYQHTNGKECFSFHFYVPDAHGRIGYKQLTWKDDWPQITNIDFDFSEK